LSNAQLLRIIYFLILLVSIFFSNLNGFSQTNRKISGKVTDSTGLAIPDATVLLTSTIDTLRSKTDSEGHFSFSKINDEKFILEVSTIGYFSYQRSFVFGKKKSIVIEDIKLKLAGNMLKEVVIKAKPNPIRIMKDTIEYNAAAYKVLEGDNVADLVKQFSGMEVDHDYNVKSMGKNVVKLRVNGKDFFTSDVKEFLATLPAAIVSKIQIIDDYGEQANFTGIKIGDPQKLINIITNPGMDRGKFGNLAVNAGTNKQIGSKNNINLWDGDKQTGLGLNYTTQDNGAGNSSSSIISVNHRNKLSKNGNFSINYGLNNAANAFTTEQAVETLSDLGTYYNATRSNGKSKNYNHNLSSDFYMYTTDEKWFLNGSLNANFNENANDSFSVNNQSGVTKQDFKNLSKTDGRSPNISLNMNLSKRLKNSKNQFSANFGFSNANQISNQLVNTNTLYYDQQDQTLLKDSVLNRNIDNLNHSQNFMFDTNYSFSVSKPKDSLVKANITFNYAIGVTNSFNRSTTSVLSNLNNEYQFVDSLSSELKSLFITQTIGANYNRNSNKTHFAIGINARPNLLTNTYINLNQKTQNNNFNYSPTLNYSKTISTGKTISLNYNGDNNSPLPSQLQPIKNTQNLQNIIIGNPDLKPSFEHRIVSNYNYVEAKSGMNIFVAANFSTTQNEIINNVIVVPDTLGSFRQETRYENTNGTYNISGNYSISYPLKKGLLTIGNNGTLGFSNRALFINNERYFNSGFNFSQQISGDLNLKKMSFTLSTGFRQVNNNNIQSQNNLINLISGDLALSGNPSFTYIPPSFNPGQLTTTQFFVTRTLTSNFNGRAKFKNFNMNGSANYSYSSNSNASALNEDRDLQTLSLTFNGNATLKSYRLGVSISKRINSGYAIANQNPLLIGANLSKQFLKNKSLSLIASASDLLNQGNSLFRQVSGNSVIDSKNNVITRVFSIGLTFNLSKFGANGTTYYVDPD